MTNLRAVGLASGQATPVTAGERLWTLDVVRGFTLIGVLLVNVSDFTRNDHHGLDP